MKIIFFILCFLICFLCFPKSLGSTELSIRILIFSTNPLYGHAKFDVLTGIRNRLSELNYNNVVFKTINYDEKIVDYSMIERETYNFKPSFILTFDNAQIGRQRAIKIFNIRLYNVEEIVNNINTIFKKSKIKPKKIIVFYDDLTDINKEWDFSIISKNLPNIEYQHISTVLRLREILLKYQKEKDIVFITLLRYIYNIDTGEYITEPLICKEFVEYNKNHLDIAFKQHTHKYGISISIGQNNIKLGENIVNEYFKFKKEQLSTNIFVNKNKLYSTGNSFVLYENYDIISGIYEK